MLVVRVSLTLATGAGVHQVMEISTTLSRGVDCWTSSWRARSSSSSPTLTTWEPLLTWVRGKGWDDDSWGACAAVYTWCVCPVHPYNAFFYHSGRKIASMEYRL